MESAEQGSKPSTPPATPAPGPGARRAAPSDWPERAGQRVELRVLLPAIFVALGLFLAGTSRSEAGGVITAISAIALIWSIHTFGRKGADRGIAPPGA